jgi:ribosome modulation factor
MGVTAAIDGQQAGDCPFAAGRNRNDWLTGFFLAKPPFGVFVVGKLAC